MPRSKVQSRRAWPRVAVLGLVGFTAAACADSARFDAYNADRSAPPQNVASATSSRPATARVETQPLPAVSPPATVSASPNSTYVPQNSYRSRGEYSDITGSTRQASQSSSAQWTWNGGSAVTVGYGDTLDSIARKHHVPVSALMQTNGIRDAAQIKPGQRLVIPRYVANASQPASHTQAPPAAGGNVHVVQSGDTLMNIARRSGVTLPALARANKLQTTAKLSIGDRLTIPPGGHPTAVARPAPAAAPQTQVAQARAPQPEKVASLPVQKANVAKEEARPAETAVKTAEPSGAMPSFRWPVRGRVIAGFGSKPNGTQNDGINLAVPEGTPIKAADDGVVAYAGNELKGYGNLVLIRHASGFVSAYAHASEIMVKRGDTIKRGQVIAHAGQTGNVTSPQLHFEIRKGSTPVDPTQFLGGA